MALDGNTSGDMVKEVSEKYGGSPEDRATIEMPQF